MLLPATDQDLMPNQENQQKIRFCTSADGTRLAYATLGDGPPLVKASTWLTHVEKDPYNPFTRHWVSEMSRDHTFIRYDARGCGLSDREVERISLDAWIEDLEAVTAALDLDRFPLLGMSQGAAIALGYAARHPEKVSHLILYGGCARGLLKRNPPPKVIEAAQAMLKAAEIGWGADSSSFRQVFISQLFHDATAEQQRAVDEAQRLTISGANATRFLKEVFEIDVRDVAPKIQCPTLVFHAKEDPCFPFEEGRLLASLIPHARLVPLPSKNHLPFETEAAWPMFLTELRAFLPGVGREGRAGNTAAGEKSRPTLTPRQLEILREVGMGQTDKQIARKLSLSPRTVEMHVANALAALDCRTRAEAVLRASELRLTP
jgi:pimeloyl-ACP methyl ester carboxylesterase/DNA-binding CsgD family transcriptional regulator